MDEKILGCMADKGDLVVAEGDKYKLKDGIPYSYPERFSSKNI